MLCARHAAHCKIAWAQLRCRAACNVQEFSLRAAFQKLPEAFRDPVINGWASLLGTVLHTLCVCVCVCVHHVAYVLIVIVWLL